MTDLCLYIRFAVLVDLEDDGEGVLRVEGRDRLHGRLFAVLLCPDLIVRIGVELAEAVLAVIGSDEALLCKGAGVLKVHDSALERSLALGDDLTLYGAAGGCLSGCGHATDEWQRDRRKQECSRSEMGDTSR